VSLILLTSGTTGIPKRVPCTYRMLSTGNPPPPGTVTIIYNSLAWIGGNAMLWGAVKAEATVHLMDGYEKDSFLKLVLESKTNSVGLWGWGRWVEGRGETRDEGYDDKNTMTHTQLSHNSHTTHKDQHTHNNTHTQQNTHHNNTQQTHAQQHTHATTHTRNNTHTTTTHTHNNTHTQQHTQ